MGPERTPARLCGLLLLLLGGCRGPSPGSPASGAEPTPGPARPAAAPEPAAADPGASPTPASPPASRRAHDIAITVLSTSRAEVGTGEWGFAALVEVDGERILFDTGAAPRTVLRNAAAAGVDPSTITQVVLSHHHGDHVGGLLTLRRAVVDAAPEALATVHVARGIFEPRRSGQGSKQVNEMLGIRPAFEQTGGRFVVHDGPAEVAPGVWVTGPVPRVHPERNWSGSRRIPQGEDRAETQAETRGEIRTERWVEDTLPESQSLVIDSDQGLVVISGCGHAGIVNTLTHARATIREAPVRAAVGGFHLHQASAEHLDWTAEHLQPLQLEGFYGAHCTGRAAVRRLAALVGEGAALEVAVGWTLRLGDAG